MPLTSADERPFPLARLDAQGRRVSTEGRWRGLIEPLLSRVDAAGWRRARAALRLCRRIGGLRLRLAAPLEGWVAVATPTPTDVVVALSDVPQQIEAAVNQLLRLIAVDGEGFCRIDRQGRWAWTSPRLGAAALIGRKTPRAVIAAAQVGRPVVDQVIAPPREEGAVWLLTARPCFDARGRPDGLVGALRPALESGVSGDSARRLERLARAIDPGVAIFDEDGRLRFASDAYVDAFEADGLRFPLGGAATDWSSRLALGHDERPSPGEERRFEILTAESRRLALRRVALPCGGWLESLDDVTATRHAQQADAEALNRARRTERAKQAFMEAVGVELFAAAAKVRASLRAATRLNGDAVAGDFTEMMSQGLRRLFVTARDVRAYSILEDRDAQLDCVPVGLADLIHQTAAGRSADADRAGVSLRVQTPQDATRRVDPAFFALALDHLLSNAIKFSRPGGRIDLRLRFKGGPEGEAIVEVQDDGVGVTPESLERIQTPFVQGEEDAVRRAYEGSGLGLAICRAVMRLHGGRLFITGAPQQGVTARLILPGAEPAAPATAAPQPSALSAAAPDPSLFTLAPVPLALIDAEGVIRAVNAAAADFFGRAPAQLIDAPLSRLLAPGAPAVSAVDWAKGSVDRSWRTGDGDLWGRAWATPVPDDRLIIGWEDVTDLCRLTERIEDERRRHSAAAAAATDWFWRTDADHHYTFLSPRRRLVEGEDDADDADDRLTELRPAAAEDPAAAPAAARHRADLLAHRPFERWVERRRGADGRLKLRHVGGAPLFDARGRFEGYVGVVERADTLEDLRRADQAKAARLRAALDAAPFGIIIWDEDDRLVFWNRRYGEILPRLAGALRVGMPMAEASREAALRGDAPTQDPDSWTLQRAAQRRRPVTSLEIQLSDGRWTRWIDRRAADGAMIGVRLDVTSRRLAERRLAAARQAVEQADAAKRNFLAVISHELRTPLNAVIGFAELMRMPRLDGSDVAPQARHAAEEILRHGRRLQRICNHIIDYVRIEAGDYGLSEDRCALGAVLRAAAGGDRLRLSPYPVDMTLKIDPQALRRAIKLAAAALSDHLGAPVAVAAAADWADGVSILIFPNAPGVTENARESLYDVDARAQGRAPQSAVVLGEGLSLAVARGLMRIQDGDIHIADAPGEAPVLRLTLPPDRIIAFLPKS